MGDAIDDMLLMGLPSLGERRAKWRKSLKWLAPMQLALVLVGSAAHYWVADKLLGTLEMLPAWTALVTTAVFALALSSMWAREAISSYPTERDIQFDLQVRRAIHAADQRECASSASYESESCNGASNGSEAFDGYSGDANAD